jgi:transposase
MRAEEQEGAEGSNKELRLKRVNRQQMILRAVDVERLIEPEHVARAIWELVGGLDLSAFRAEIAVVEGEAGRPAYDPQLLISLWIYAYSEGVSSAREVARRCEYHPAYQWLTGCEVVNHHSLSDFRVEHQAALDELFAQVLAALRGEGMIRLERVMQDGTKVQAAASPASFHREGKLRQHLEEARERVRQMGDPRQEGPAEQSARQRQAQERAAREKLQRLEQSLEELQKVREEASSAAPAECRASETEPEARKMKQAVGGGFAPSYNVQLMTDAAQDILVGVQGVQARNDQGQLEAGLEEVQRQNGAVPKQAGVDEGYLSRATVLEMDQRGVDLIAGGQLEDSKYSARSQQNWKKRGVSAEFYPPAFVYDAERDLYVCPAGQELPHRGVKHDREGVQRHRYQAAPSPCRACPQQAQCCPVKPGQPVKGRMIVRTENDPVVAAYVEKMKTPEAQAIYRERKRIAEFPNLWIKEKLGLRRFRVRGLVKATCEALWACLTYNIQQWARLRWRPKLTATAA